MKAMKISIKNFKNIKNLEILPEGASLILLKGDNGVGKSSVLQAIELALGMTSHLPAKPVMEGKEKGMVELTMKDPDGKEYIFRTKFAAGSSRPTFEVETEDGLKDSRKGVIANLVGDISFDIFKFVEMSSTTKGQKEQVEIVRSFLDSETLEELQKIERKIEQTYNDRTEQNREIKSLEGFISESGLEPSDFTTYSEPKNIDALKSKRDEQRAAQKKRQDSISTVSSQMSSIGERQPIIEKEIKYFEERIAALKSEYSDNDEKIRKGKEWLDKNKPIDTSSIDKEYDEAMSFNSKCERVATHLKKKNQLDEYRKRSENLTIIYETSKQSLDDAIRDMAMPIKGLTFDNEKLIYNGKPVDINTLSTSEIMHIGVQLKMAKNPHAKILTIERGESLGTDKLKQILTLANKHGYQIIMEQVERQKKGKEKLIVEIVPE